MSRPVDVRGILERAGADSDAPEGSQAWALAQVDVVVADLAEQMRDVLALWDSNGMSIDGKAATMQCRPDKWRAALAAVRSAP